MVEQWKDISGFESRYQVSDLGRVRSLSHAQRYVKRNGVEAYRTTADKALAQQPINSGYLIAHLHLDNQRTALLVHRLVAQAFIAGTGETVNHIDGVKTNNSASNLEWATYTENHDHAVRIGLNPTARRVIGTPITGGEARMFGSQSQAALSITGKRWDGTKISACLQGKRATAFGHTWTAA